MLRSFIAAMMFGVACMPVKGQQAATTEQETAVAASSTSLHQRDFVDRSELLRQAAAYEAVATQAEAKNSHDSSLIQVYVQLGGIYTDLAMFAKAEDAVQRAIALLRGGPQVELAEEIGHSAELHVVTNDLHAAEKEHLEALKIRESVGDPVGIALTWSDLASLYMKERQYKKALDFGKRAMTVMGDNPTVSPADKVAIRLIVGSAFVESHDYASGMSLLKDALAMATSNFGPDSLSVAMASFVLGYGYWRSGDMADAADPMARGTAGMKTALGWHPLYLNAMKNYAKFLRQRGQLEAAAAAEREIRQAAQTVDARTLTARTSAFAGPR